MAWHDFLKKLPALIHIDFSKLEKIQLFNIHINTNSRNTERAVITENPPRLVINSAAFIGQEREALQAVLREGYGESGNILMGPARGQIEDFHRIEGDERYQRDYEFFRDKIPARDVNLLRACLFLRTLDGQGKNISETKQQIYSSYGARGGNFANLCSAGYLEDWFRPFWASLLASGMDPAQVKEEFQKTYNEVVCGLPWTIFVKRMISADQVREETLAKIASNLRYGIRKLNVHGIGQDNVDKIRGLVVDVERAYPAVNKIVTEQASRISVQFIIPAVALPPPLPQG